MQSICHQEEAQPEAGARDWESGGPDFCCWCMVGFWPRYSSPQKRSYWFLPCPLSWSERKFRL